MSCLAKPSGNKGVREPLHELPLLREITSVGDRQDVRLLHEIELSKLTVDLRLFRQDLCVERRDGNGNNYS
jgi:hypothetical protein